MPDKPRFIDLQINGYTGVDFNQDDLSEVDLHLACQCLREDGVAGILATIITAEIPLMSARLARIAAIRKRDPLVRDVILGMHIEGPFISDTPGFVGAHPPHAVRPADVDAMKQLVDAAEGLTRLVTLAPERDQGLKLVRYLADQKILVAAGHCDPNLHELQSAIDAGLSMFTHLGNGCPTILNRHDNIIQRALSLRKRLILCFVADGAHVPPMALANYVQLAGVEHCIAVTDAISAARLGPGRYAIGSQIAVVGEDLVCRSPDGPHLVGSAATMPRMVSVLRDQVGLSDSEVRQLLVDNPRTALAQTCR